jgi:hypothetical protein
MFRRGVLPPLLAGACCAASVALACPGDLNGDTTVTVDEVVIIIGAALSRCPEELLAPPPCPGDLDGNGFVTIDEIVTVIATLLQGCPTPTPTPSPTPTPTPSVCPYTFADNTLEGGGSCSYAGPFTADESCPQNLGALFLSDGELVAASVTSDPLITFGAVVQSPTAAALVAYFVGDDLTPQPLAGVMQLTDGGNTLIIDPETVPDFNIGGPDCPFDRYTGAYTGVVTGP